MTNDKKQKIENMFPEDDFHPKAQARNDFCEALNINQLRDSNARPVPGCYITPARQSLS